MTDRDEDAPQEDKRPLVRCTRGQDWLQVPSVRR